MKKIFEAIVARVCPSRLRQAPKVALYLAGLGESSFCQSVEQDVGTPSLSKLFLDLICKIHCLQESLSGNMEGMYDITTEIWEAKATLHHRFCQRDPTGQSSGAQADVGCLVDHFRRCTLPVSELVVSAAQPIDHSG